MKNLSLSKFGLTGLFAAGLLAFAGTSHAQTPTIRYNSLTGTASTQATFDYAQQVTLAGGANQAYSISAMTIGLNFADPNSGFVLVLDFYTGADTSPTATNALAGATDVNELAYDFAAGSVAAAGNYTVPLTFPAFNISTGTFVVAVELLTEDETTYSSTAVVNARFTLAGPTVGSSPGFVWSDSNLDGVFAGSEQTTFGAAAANIRMSITAVPEPGTNAALAFGGVALLGGVYLRRRRVVARG